MEKGRKRSNPITKLLLWHFSKTAMPYWCVLMCDSLIVIASLFVSHILNSDESETARDLGGLFIALLAYLTCYLVSFRLFHTYSGIVRYSSFKDLVNVGLSVLVGSVMVQGLRAIAHTDRILAIISSLDLVLGSILAILLMWFVRIFVKMAFEGLRGPFREKNVLIIGTDSRNLGLANILVNQRRPLYKLRGFLTPTDDMLGHTLMGKPVLYLYDPKIWDFIERKNINAVFVSSVVHDVFVNKNQSIIDELISRGIKILMMPKEFEWDGKSDISNMELREVDIEDLLPRNKIDVDMVAVEKMLKGERVLITGAAGSIGLEIVSQVASFGPEELVLVDQAETPMYDLRLMMAEKFPELKTRTVVASISDTECMESLFRDERPQYVFHAAAYKHVPMMEDNPASAVRNNILGVRVLADMAVKYGTEKFVMISTDKAVNPTSVMGCSKRICEIYCQSLSTLIAKKDGSVLQADGTPAVTQFVTTRFGNVLGSSGSVIPIFKEMIRRGGPVKVTHPDIVRYFMLIPEACKLVLEAGTIGRGGEIFVFDMGSPVRIADLAQRMIDLSGKSDVKIEYVGLRPGEKLYEEVLGAGENDRPTFHPKIKIAAVREYSYEEALRQIEELQETSYSGDSAAIIAKMKEIVPEYTSPPPPRITANPGALKQLNLPDNER